MPGRDRRRRTPHRSATRKRGPAPRAHPEQELGPEAQPLIQEIRAALRDEDRLQVLRLVSSIVAALDLADDAHGGPGPLVELADTFMGVDIAETTAVLHVLAALTDDEMLASRIKRVLPARRQPVPDHVRDLVRVTVDDAVYMGEELGDGENVMLSVSWPTGPGATVAVYIDHATGTRVKDAMILDEPIEEMVDTFRELMDEDHRPGGVLEAMDVADARATIEWALRQGEVNDLVDPFVDEDEATEDWPLPRPIVQMLLRRMPPGGSPVGRLVDLEDLTPIDALRDFLESPEARGMDTGPQDEGVEAVRILFGYAATYSGHPLRWSPRTLEIAAGVLAFDGGITDPVLDSFDEVLPRLVVYSLRRTGVSEEAVEDTMTSIHDMLDHLDDLRDPDGLGLDDLDDLDGLGDLGSLFTALMSGDHGPIHRALLVEEVGSEEALAVLTDEPLPAESLDLSRLPQDVREPVAEINGWVDRWIEESEDARDLGREAEELRTACRRFLVTAAVGDPTVFRRRARADLSALAVLWIVGRVNGLVGHSPAPVRTGGLQEWFGAKSMPSGRADSLTGAFGGDTGTFQPALGDARLLTSRKRAALIDRRDALADEG